MSLIRPKYEPAAFGRNAQTLENGLYWGVDERYETSPPFIVKKQDGNFWSFGSTKPVRIEDWHPGVKFFPVQPLDLAQPPVKP